MRRTKRGGGFFLCLLLNVLLNWEGRFPRRSCSRCTGGAAGRFGGRELRSRSGSAG